MVPYNLHITIVVKLKLKTIKVELKRQTAWSLKRWVI